MKSARTVCALMLGWVLFMAIDCGFYAEAKYPERTSSWGYKLPGGGIVAYVKFGRVGEATPEGRP